jgi:hypothetical protein
MDRYISSDQIGLSTSHRNAVCGYKNFVLLLKNLCVK